MRLEFDSDTLTLPFNKTEAFDNIVADGFSQAEESLRAGIAAAQSGNRAEARCLLMNVAEIEPHNENAWLWLASISEYPEELLIFLHNVLEINPTNERAIEWMKATKSLLAETFVQRGIDAANGGQNDFARQCFYHAVGFDAKNETGWLWLAFVSPSAEEKKSYLDKVLSINPENEAAQTALKELSAETAKSLLRKAFAALADDPAAAKQILSEALQKCPELADAWLLKSHLSDSIDEKIRCFEKILEINPAHEAANAGLNSLLAFIKDAAPKAETENSQTQGEEQAAGDENNESAGESRFEENLHAEHTESENPTQELKFTETSDADISFVTEQETEFHETEEAAFTETSLAEEEKPFAEEAYFEEEKSCSLAENAESEEFEEAAEAEEYVPAANYDAPINEVSQPNDNDSENDFYQEDNMLEVENYQSESSDSFGFHSNEQTVFEEFDLMLSAECAVETPENREFSGEPRQNVAPKLQTEFSACPFCNAETEAQAFACKTCRVVFSLSDLEMLLANQNADNETLRQAVERMETRMDSRDFGENEFFYNLFYLGVGHINLKNLRHGFAYLQKASQANPNDVLLSSQVNALAIRLEEIERHDEVHDAMLKGRKILVVDDSPTVRKLISGKLEKSGHEVVCAVDGMDALAKLKEVMPDLILLDITMPRMDGYQVCKLIRSNPTTKDIPIVMISGKDGFFDKVRGRMAGTTGYITKPFGPETLMKALDVYIKSDGEDAFFDEEAEVSLEM
jgi:twitching motility two-component system response regulator PilG